MLGLCLLPINNNFYPINSPENILQGLMEGILTGPIGINIFPGKKGKTNMP